MKIQVELIANLSEYSPTGKGKFEYELEEGATANKLVDALGIPDEQAGAIVIDGLPGDATQPLTEGQTVTLIPPMAGG